MADVQRAKDTATADACRVTLAIFFTALLDKEGMDAEQLQRSWREVEALSESVRVAYVSAPDLIRVLREEYEIDIIGGSNDEQTGHTEGRRRMRVRQPGRRLRQPGG